MYGEDLEKKKMKVRIRTMKKFLAMCEASVAIF